MGRRGGRTRPGGSQGTGQDAGAFLCRCGCSGGPASFSEEAGGRVGEGSSAAGGSCRPWAGSLPGPGGCERAGCRLDWRTPSPSRPRGPRRGALQRGDSRLEPAPLGPSSWALLPGFAGRGGFVITKEACFPSVTQSTALGSSVISFITLDFY